MTESAQFVEPTVSRAKFEREIAEFRALEGEYQSRGWFLIHADFPHIRVLLAARQLRPPAIVVGVAFDYTNYDAEPPSVRLVDPFTQEPYPTKDLPTALNQAVRGAQVSLPGIPALQVQTVQSLMQSYGPDDIPFLCLAGVREYHTHPGHSGDAWELHRAAGAGRLVRLLSVIDQFGVKPIIRYSVDLEPRIRLEFGNPPT